MSNAQQPQRRPAPRKRKQRKRKRLTPGRIILRTILIVIIVAIFAIAGALLGAYMGIVDSAPTMNTDDVVPENYTSIVYDSAGKEIDRLHGEENREYVQLDQIPENLQKAVVSIEDERFYEHNGIDPKGILRALMINIQTHSFSQGASTITQQLIKNEVLTSEKQLTRKIQEQYLAVQLEKNLTEKLGSKEAAKNYILELYLNTMSLGHGLNGVQAASLYYFGKNVSELTLAECATLAGITKNPSYYSPVRFPEHITERRATVLQKMVDLGYITQAQADEANATDVTSLLASGDTTVDQAKAANHTYFVDQVILDVANALMEEKGMSKAQAYNMIYSGGLSIHTTLDQSIQSVLDASYQKAELFPPSGRDELSATYTISVMDTTTEEQSHYSRSKIVSNQEEAEAFAQSVQDELITDGHRLVADNLQVTYSLQSAMVIMDQSTGYVKALIGGRGEKQGDLVYNRATQALRQPGSCFKVLAAYAPALDLGLLTPASSIKDEAFTVGGWSPRNWWGSKYRGYCTVREGIRDSMNILAAKTMALVTPERAYEYLLNFGFTSLVKSREVNGQIFSDINYSTSLGGLTDGVSVLELTAAYAAIANGGVYNKPTTYTAVYDHNGNLLLSYNNESHRVIHESVAWLLTDMMKDVITGGGSATGRLANFTQNSMPIAGKTGTTTNDYDLTFAGYTPYYTAGIWLGYDQPKTMKYDKSYHLLLWRDVMDQLHNNLPRVEFERPANISSVTLCSVSNQMPSDLCSQDYYGCKVVTDYYATDVGAGISSEPCTLHKTFTIDNTTGYLAGDDCPAEYRQEVVLAVDEEGKILNMPDSFDENGEILKIVLEPCTIDHSDYHAPDSGVIGGEEEPEGGDPTDQPDQPDQPDSPDQPTPAVPQPEPAPDPSDDYIPIGG